MRHRLVAESIAGHSTDWAHAYKIVGMATFRIREEKDGGLYVVSERHAWHRPIQGCTDAVGPFGTVDEAVTTLILMEG